MAHTIGNPWGSKPNGWPRWGLTHQSHLPTVLSIMNHFWRQSYPLCTYHFSLNGKNVKRLQQPQKGHPSCHFLPLSFRYRRAVTITYVSTSPGPSVSDLSAKSSSPSVSCSRYWPQIYVHIGHDWEGKSICLAELNSGSISTAWLIVQLQRVEPIFVVIKKTGVQFAWPFE